MLLRSVPLKPKPLELLVRADRKLSRMVLAPPSLQNVGCRGVEDWVLRRVLGDVSERPFGDVGMRLVVLVAL